MCRTAKAVVALLQPARVLSHPAGAWTAAALLLAPGAQGGSAVYDGQAAADEDIAAHIMAAPAAARPGEISRDQAVTAVQKRFNARAVRVDEIEAEGRRVYVIRLLSVDSRVWNVRVDAITGAILN